MALTKGGRAKERHTLASAENKKALRNYRRAHREYEKALQTLGGSKLAAVRGPISTFEKRSRLLNNEHLARLLRDALATSPQGSKLEALSLGEFKDVVDAYGAIAAGFGLGAVGSAGASVAIPAAVAQFATVTGGTTAISSLSGAAATNATMAWLGGGSVSAGGGGMAAGATVLSVAAAAPVVLIGGGVLWWKTRAATKERLETSVEIEAETAKLQLPTAQLRRLTEMARHLHELLERLLPLMRSANTELGQMLARETDYPKMTAADQRALSRIVTTLVVGIRVVQCELATPKGNPRQAARLLQSEVEAFLVSRSA